MARLYRDISDTLNKTPFDVRVPDDYEPVLPGYYKKFPERNPFYYGTTEDCYSSLPIASIIDMCVNNITFTIVNRDDVLLIVTLIKQYVNAMGPRIDHFDDTTQAKIFLANCRRALAVLGESDQRAEREEKDDQVYKKPSGLLDVLNAMNNLGGGF